MEYRRRAPRAPSAWAGFCLIDGDLPSLWRDCEVIDVSTLGLGITFHHPQPCELVHRRILVDVSAIGDAVNIRLEGVIRDAAFTLEGQIRVGVEFVGSPTPSAQLRRCSAESTGPNRGRRGRRWRTEGTNAGQARHYLTSCDPTCCHKSCIGRRHDGSGDSATPDESPLTIRGPTPEPGQRFIGQREVQTLRSNSARLAELTKSAVVGVPSPHELMGSSPATGSPEMPL
jgi:hypothetical protein